jgi:hypothetical protein
MSILAQSLGERKGNTEFEKFLQAGLSGHYFHKENIRFCGQVHEPR